MARGHPARYVTVLDGVRLCSLFLGQWIRFGPLHKVKHTTHFEITPSFAANIHFACIHGYPHRAFVWDLPTNDLSPLG